MKTDKVLVIVGPTATGKSELAIKVAKKIPAEIISADSMQVYKGMDIGTAKVDIEIRKKYKHHLIDVTSINEPFNVVKYQQMARATVAEIQASSKLPIIVGGSGLYVRATIYKLNFPPDNQNADVRQKLEDVLQKKGLDYLKNQLKQRDPEAYETIDINNNRRLVRALEVINNTGKPYSSFREDWHNWQSLYDATIIGLTLPREILYRRINKRVDTMMDEGLLDETKKLVSQGLKEAIIAHQALGYKELIEYLDGKTSLTEAINTLKKRTRNYAKRQYTWFKKDKGVIWYDVNEKSMDEIANLVFVHMAK